MYRKKHKEKYVYNINMRVLLSHHVEAVLLERSAEYGWVRLHTL